MTVLCSMGKISGTMLSQSVGRFPLNDDAVIHSFDVIGPELIVQLTGAPANADVPVQGWVFLN